MSLSRIPGNEELYIGGIFTLNRLVALQAANITHILSVLRYDFKDFKDWDKYEHCSVQVDDVEDENLLGEFSRTNKFIREGLQGGGGVLVHCAMGRSRSATVIVAYLLSTRPQTCPSVSSALALVRQTRPMAEPNSGFMKQLELYKAMGCPSDIDAEPAYQRWLYKLEVESSLAIGRAPERLRFEDEIAEAANTSPASSSEQRERQKELRCRKCRRTLATHQYLIPHTPQTSSNPPPSPPPSADTPPTGPISSLPFSSSSSSTHATAPPSPPCTHHFLQPLSWMRPTLSQGLLSGRLECPNGKCAQQVGRYAWQGLKCSCGHWVVPGFSVAAGKVDEVVLGRGGGKGAAPGLRMPAGVDSGVKGIL